MSNNVRTYLIIKEILKFILSVIIGIVVMAVIYKFLGFEITVLIYLFGIQLDTGRLMEKANILLKR